MATRGFAPKANLLAKQNPLEFRGLAKEGYVGFDRMIFDKLRFFHLVGNVFGAFVVWQAYRTIFVSDAQDTQNRRD